MNYTKGEWYIEKTYGIPEIRTKERRIAKPLYHMGSEDREVEANAQLMVASPLMYEALKTALLFMAFVKGRALGPADIDSEELFNVIEQAINKADGK